MDRENRRIRLLFYTAWIVTLLLQCFFVGLSGDEAYYWRYSRELAWGYFDHPPFTALLVKAGYAIFQNELGVRLFFIALVTSTIFALEQLVKPANLRLFYAIVLSIAFLQVGIVWGGGMMAIPDFPLLFFEALFFLLYREYLEKPSLKTVVLMPVVIGLMLLTKYHGILVVGLTILSNISLLKRGSFWVVALLSSAMLIPHIYWQVVNDFPSVRYHLLERSSDPYTFNHMAEYLGTQPFVLGPIIGILLIYAGIAYKPATDFERSLKFTVIGTYLFFLVMSIKGRVEGNWTIITLVPLVCLGYKYVESRERLRKATMYGFFVSIFLIVALRVVITIHLPLPRADRFIESLTPWTWCAELKQKTGGKPAAFINSYQKASLYEFYEGIPSFSLNNFWHRKNQYTIWDTEANFQGMDVALISNWEMANLDTIRIMGEYFPYTTISNFRSTSNLRFSSNLDEPVSCTPSAKIEANIMVNYSNDHKRDLEANPQFTTTVAYAFFQGKTSKTIANTPIILKNDMIGSGKSYHVVIQAPLETGHYDLYFAAGTGWLPFGINSPPIKFIVED